MIEPSTLARQTNIPLGVVRAYEPAGRRTRWALLYECPCCGKTHFGRSQSPDVNGIRRSGCGRRIQLISEAPHV